MNCSTLVKGYTQLAVLDFDQTFTPIITIESVRAILAIAATYDLFILHINCTNAFLNGLSDMELYVLQSEGLNICIKSYSSTKPYTD